MSKDLNIRHIDKRTLDRQLEKGYLKKEDYEAHLNALPDLEGEMENIAEKIYGAAETDEGDGDGADPVAAEEA